MGREEDLHTHHSVIGDHLQGLHPCGALIRTHHEVVHHTALARIDKVGTVTGHRGIEEVIHSVE